jgi:hypothetical protein
VGAVFVSLKLVPSTLRKDRPTKNSGLILRAFQKQGVGVENMWDRVNLS